MIAINEKKELEKVIKALNEAGQLQQQLFIDSLKNKTKDYQRDPNNKNKDLNGYTWVEGKDEIYSEFGAEMQNIIAKLPQAIKEEKPEMIEPALSGMSKKIEVYKAKFSNYNDGTDRTNHFTTDVTDDPNAYNPTGAMDPAGADEITKVTSKILTVTTNIGMIASVLILAFIGIKYIIGSVEEKAEYKEAFWPYLVGAILLMGITTVIKIIQLIGDQINI